MYRKTRVKMRHERKKWVIHFRLKMRVEELKRLWSCRTDDLGGCWSLEPGPQQRPTNMLYIRSDCCLICEASLSLPQDCLCTFHLHTDKYTHIHHDIPSVHQSCSVARPPTTSTSASWHTHHFTLILTLSELWPGKTSVVMRLLKERTGALQDQMLRILAAPLCLGLVWSRPERREKKGKETLKIHTFTL